MPRLLRPNHPFNLLLYLEWVLLGIALLSFLVPFPRAPFWSVNISPRWGLRFPLGVLLCILALGGMGWRLPIGRSRLVQWLYISVGLVLCWATVLMGGRFRDYFTPMLLIVVIRASLIFPWKERLIVALVAFGSFLLPLITGFQNVRGSGWGRSRLRPPSPWPYRSEFPEDLLFNLQIKAGLLFGLVLVFVLLMVGALLTEYHSRNELAAANMRLRQYAVTIESQATLQERNRIAREMHDSVGHALTAQSIQLENVDLWIGQDLSKAHQHLHKARQLGKEALQNVRQTVATLRTDPLRGQSLSSALRQLTQDFERTTAIAVRLDLAASLAVPKDIAAALYRLIQEALTNVSRHSRATQVQIDLQETSQGLCLDIIDNGQGFQLTQNTTGFGLQGMKERTAALGGTFQLTSQPQQGCQVQIVIPRPGALI